MPTFTCLAIYANLCLLSYINIKYRAVGHPVLKAQEMSLTGVTAKPLSMPQHECREYVTVERLPYSLAALGVDERHPGTVRRAFWPSTS